MKKIFGISLVSVLMSMSMLAGAMAYDYSPLISTRPDSYGYKSADGSDEDNAVGLANGEWKLTWNSYGTAKGTSICSSDGGNWEYNTGTAISGTPASSTDPDAQVGCWCKLTGFTDNNNTTYSDTSLWVLSYALSASGCTGSCAELCGQYLTVDYDGMRSNMFGSISQGSGSGADEPTAGDANSPTATNAPKYGLMGAGTNDGNGASAGYVKGAYNALIKGINKTHDEVGTLNTNIGTYSNSISHLTDGKATQTGTVKTIKAATTSETINSSSVNITGVTTSSISATASGNVNLSMRILDNWGSDTLSSNPINTTTSFSNLTVNNMSMAAPTSNTATLTKNNIAGTVNVAEYLAQAQAQAAAHFSGYQILININPDSYGYKLADGSDSDNADGLANGEWKVTWRPYGTAKGTSMCSASWNGYEVGNTITGTPASITDQSAKAGCWCKLTGFTDVDEITYNDTSLWVFVHMNSSASDCASDCANNCGFAVLTYRSMRSGVLGSVQQ